MYVIITKSRCWELYSQPPRLASLDDDCKKTKITMKLLLGFKKKHNTDNYAQKYFKKNSWWEIESLLFASSG